MNILVADAQGVLSSQQKAFAENRLRFSLARFDHRVNGATMHFSLDEKCENVSCTINVSIENAGVVSVTKRSVASQEVLNLAVDAIEPQVAYRIDWSMWFNADTFATWALSVSEPLNRLLGFSRPSVRWPRRAVQNLERLGFGANRSGTFSS